MGAAFRFIDFNFYEFTLGQCGNSHIQEEMTFYRKFDRVATVTSICNVKNHVPGRSTAVSFRFIVGAFISY